VDLKERGYDDVDWINLAENADQWLVLVNTVMKFQVA
jgi:hypothetical protein